MGDLKPQLEIATIPVTPIQQNCRVLYNKDATQALVIDPGGDADLILTFLKKHRLQCTQIWLTHSHLDHCGGVLKLLAASSEAILFGHPVEVEFRRHVVDICAMYGIPPGSMENCPEPDKYLTGGETIDFAGYNFKVLFTPGHSPGHLCFYQGDTGNLIAGDTLFLGSIGRTDLPGGDHQTLLKSIREEIFTLPDQTIVLPGHGPNTTVLHERMTNPFLQG